MAKVTLDEIDNRISVLEKKGSQVTIDDIDKEIFRRVNQQGNQSFMDKTLDVASRVPGMGIDIAGFDVPQTLAKTGAYAASPVIDKEGFRTTPVFESAGDISGGFIGYQLGGTKGAVALSGLAGAGGRVIDDELRRIMGLLSPEDQKILSRIESAGEAGLTSMAGEFIPEVLKPVAGRALKPFKGVMSKRAKDALRFFRENVETVKSVFGKEDVIPFLPAQGTDVTARSSVANILDTLQNITEKSIFGGGGITSRKIGIAQVDEILLRNLINNIDSADLGPDALANLLRQSVQNNDDILNALINRRYTAVNNRVKKLTTRILGEEVAPEGITFRPKKQVGIIRMLEPRKFAQEVSDLGKKVNGIGDTEQGFNIADKLLKLLKQDQGYVDYETAQLLRSTYATKLRNREIAQETGPINMRLQSLITKIDNSIKASLAKHDPKALEMWLSAKTLRLKRGKTFQNDLIKKLLDTAPEQTMMTGTKFVDSFLGQGSKIDVANIRKLKNAVGKNEWQKAKRFITQGLLLRSAEPGMSRFAVAEGRLGKETGEGLKLVGAKLEEELFGSKGMGMEVLKELYTSDEIKTLKNVANSLALIQEPQAQGTGGMFIQLTQGGAILGVGGLRKAATILATPFALSKLFTSELGGRWLTEGLTAPVGSSEAIKAFTKLSGAITTLEARERRRKINTRNPRLSIRQ